MLSLHTSYICILAQDKLGDVVYAELPEVGLELEVEGNLITLHD